MPSDTQEKRIASVRAYVEEITRMRKDAPANYSEQWFFRGQKNATWDVRPSIFRDDCLAFEHAIIERAQRQNPVEFRECINKFEVLTKLQHYGLGTRLLDVTLNPLVALFFATEPSSEFVENQNRQYSLKTHDGRVFYRFVTGCTLQDLQIRVALAVPFVALGKSLSLEGFVGTLKDNGTISQAEYEQLINDDYSEMIRLLQINSFIIATNSNVRLIQQRGAFLLSPSVNIKTSVEIKGSILAKARRDLSTEFEGSFVIPKNSKAEIREELDFFNVNEATLFPELEHQMLYIQKQAKASVGEIEDYRQYVRRTEYVGSLKIPGVFAALKTLADILTIVNSSLSSTPQTSQEKIAGIVDDATKITDWQKKDSIISHMRRSIVNVLTESMPADDAKSKANEIIDKVLE